MKEDTENELTDNDAANTSETALNEHADRGLQGAAELAKKLPLFGHAVWLYTQSPAHRYFFIQDMESRVLPPMVLDQCKLYMQSAGGSLPVAFVSWAYLNDEAEEKYIATQRIAPNEWKSGDRLWLVDVLAPFGGEQAILKELFNEIMKNTEVYMLYPSSVDDRDSKDGNGAKGEQGGLVKKSLSDLILQEKSRPSGSQNGETTRH